MLETAIGPPSTSRLGRLLALAFMTVAVCSVPAFAAGVEGLWLVENGEARVEIGSCAEALCGRIVWMEEPFNDQGERKRDIHNPDAGLRERGIVGLEILRGVGRAPEGETVWKGGTIYDPNNGKTYRCTLRLEGPDRLRIRGFVGVSLFGRNTHWTRVHDDSPRTAN